MMILKYQSLRYKNEITEPPSHCAKTASKAHEVYSSAGQKLLRANAHAIKGQLHHVTAMLVNEKRCFALSGSGVQEMNSRSDSK